MVENNAQVPDVIENNAQVPDVLENDAYIPEEVEANGEEGSPIDLSDPAAKYTGKKALLKRYCEFLKER